MQLVTRDDKELDKDFDSEIILKLYSENIDCGRIASRKSVESAQPIDVHAKQAVAGYA